MFAFVFEKVVLDNWFWALCISQCWNVDKRQFFSGRIYSGHTWLLNVDRPVCQKPLKKKRISALPFMS